jgi:hypothetical protein
MNQIRKNNNPSVIGVVKSISGTNVAVQLYPALNSSITYINGSGYKIGQVGGFVKIPQGYINLYGTIVQVGADAIPESLRDNTNIGVRWMTVQLVGEGAKGQPFERGISQYPMVDDEVHIVTEDDLESIYGREKSLEFVSVGTISGADNIPALIDINKLVSRHSAVVGSTGTGKSTTVAGLINTLTDVNKFPSSRIVLIDIHGEYGNTFKNRANVFRVYAEKDYELKLAVPYWAMSFDEFVSFTFGEISDNDRAQISDLVLKLKKLTIRENKAKFSYLNEELISVDSPIPFSFKRLFLYLYRVVFSTHTSKPAGQKLCDIDADFSIEDTTEAFSEDDAGNKRSGSIEPFILPQYLPNENQRIFLSNGVLNIKRQLLSLQARMSDPRYDFIFNPIDYVPDEKGNVNKDVDSLLESWVGDKQLSVFDVSGVPSSILIDIVGILLRLMYDSLFWSRNLPQGARNRPLLVIMEEAHNYLGTNNTNRASSIVRRLVKEGRKYGIGAMIVSQRPSEIDPTILSQCGTTISLRLTNSNDRGIVANTVSDNLSGLVNMLPILKTGESIIVGEAVRMPMRANISLPEEVSRPDSQDPRVAGENEDGSKLGWNQKLKVADDDYLNVSKTWRSQNVKLQ